MLFRVHNIDIDHIESPALEVVKVDAKAGEVRAGGDVDDPGRAGHLPLLLLLAGALQARPQ